VSNRCCGLVREVVDLCASTKCAASERRETARGEVATRGHHCTGSVPIKAIIKLSVKLAEPAWQNNRRQRSTLPFHRAPTTNLHWPLVHAYLFPVNCECKGRRSPSARRTLGGKGTSQSVV